MEQWFCTRNVKGRDQEVGFGIKVNSRVECQRGKGPMQAGEGWIETSRRYKVRGLVVRTAGVWR